MLDDNSKIEVLLEKIEKNTTAQVAELGSVAYFVGAMLAFGMNLAHPSGNFLLALFSWANVGFIWVDSMS